MNYLWIGMYLPDVLLADYQQMGFRSLSCLTAQRQLLDGLRANGVAPDTLSGIKPALWPRCRRFWIRGRRWREADGSSHTAVGLLNRPLLDRLSRMLCLWLEARRWARRHREEETTVLVYEMHSPYLYAAAAIRRRMPQARVVLLVPDLPAHMDLHMSRFKRLLKRVDGRLIRLLCCRVDRYVLYAAPMASSLGLSPERCIVIEGCLDTSAVLEPPLAEPAAFTMLYCGALEERYGIMSLLDAFDALPGKGWALWFTGAGHAETLIRKRAAADKRIRLFGYLPDRRKVLELQQKATLLLNLRSPQEAASAVCFPSKLLEYMASGRPVLSVHMAGVPDAYRPYLIEAADASSAALKEAIRRAAAMPEAERRRLGMAARDFVLKEKNSREQAARLLTFCGGESQ